MQTLLLVLGSIVLAVTVVDVLWTTIWAGVGAGPLTARILDGAWRGFLRFGPERGRHQLLRAVGYALLMGTIVGWFTMLYAGWLMIVASHPDALVDSATDRPASTAERAYFVAYTMLSSTGAFESLGAYRLARIGIIATGLVFVTLVISYLVPIVTATSDKRTFAANVLALGATPQEVVLTLWDRRSFAGSVTYLTSLVAALGTVSQRHVSYPILHLMHARRLVAASTPAVVLLDEALTLLDEAVRPDARPPAAVLAAARGAVNEYLRTVGRRLPSRDVAAPPVPSLERLRDAGVPVVADDAFRRALAEREERRRTLHSVLASDGWAWSDIAGTAMRGDQAAA